MLSEVEVYHILNDRIVSVFFQQSGYTCPLIDGCLIDTIDIEPEMNHGLYGLIMENCYDSGKDDRCIRNYRR